MFFKIFPITMYTILHAFEPIVETLLPLWWRDLQNMHAERTNCFFRCWKWKKKRWPLIFFRFGNKKQSFGAKSGLYGEWLIKSLFWVLINAAVWADVWELALSWWRMIRLRWLVFLISWKTTGKQMVVYHSELTVLHCSSGTIATCPVFSKEQQIICMQVLCARATFVGFGSSWNTHTVSWNNQLLSTFGLIRVNSRFIACHYVLDVFRSTAILFLEHFFRPIDRSLILSDWQIVWDPTQTNFFDSQMFMQYWLYAGPTIAQSCLNLTKGHIALF